MHNGYMVQSRTNTQSTLSTITESRPIGYHDNGALRLGAPNYRVISTRPEEARAPSNLSNDHVTTSSGRLNSSSGHVRSRSACIDGFHNSNSSGYESYKSKDSESSLQKHRTATIEKGGLPATRNGGLVANQKPTNTQTRAANGGRAHGKASSLPNTSLRHAQDPESRHITSAPGRDDLATGQRSKPTPQAPLPKLNTLVSGRYTTVHQDTARTKPQGYGHAKQGAAWLPAAGKTSTTANNTLSTQRHPVTTTALPDWLHASSESKAKDAHKREAIKRTDDPSSKPWLQTTTHKTSAKTGDNDDVTPRAIAHDTQQKTQQQALHSSVHEKPGKQKEYSAHELQQPLTLEPNKQQKRKLDLKDKHTNAKRSISKNKKRASKKHKLDSSHKTKTARVSETGHSTDSESSTDDEQLFSFVKRKPVVLPVSLQEKNRTQLDSKKPRDTSERAKKYTTLDAVTVYCADYMRGKSKPSFNDTKSSKQSVDSQKTASNHYMDSKSKIPPWHRKEYVLNKREAAIYTDISKVYSSEKIKKNRQNQFYKKLLELQLDHWRQEHTDYQRKQQKSEQKQLEQQRQLARLRNKFTEEQLDRFRSQYITSRVLAHEWSTRSEYGLPDEYNVTSQRQTTGIDKANKPKKVFSFKDHYMKNKKKFDTIFKHTDLFVNNDMKPPKMEGIDTVALDGSHQRDVKDILGEAKKFLDTSDGDLESLTSSSSDDETSNESDAKKGGRFTRPQKSYMVTQPVVKRKIKKAQKAKKEQPKLQPSPILKQKASRKQPPVPRKGGKSKQTNGYPGGSGVDNEESNTSSDDVSERPTRKGTKYKSMLTNWRLDLTDDQDSDEDDVPKDNGVTRQTTDTLPKEATGNTDERGGPKRTNSQSDDDYKKSAHSRGDTTNFDKELDREPSAQTGNENDSIHLEEVQSQDTDQQDIISGKAAHETRPTTAGTTREANTISAGQHYEVKPERETSNETKDNVESSSITELDVHSQNILHDAEPDNVCRDDAESAKLVSRETTTPRPNSPTTTEVHKSHTESVPASTSKDKDSIPHPKSTEKDPISASASKDNDSVPASKSTEKDPMSASASKDKDSVPASKSTEKDPISASASKDKDSVPASKSTENDPIPASSSKDRDSVPASKSTEKDPISASASKEGNIPASTSKETDPIPASKDDNYVSPPMSRDKEPSSDSTFMTRDPIRAPTSREKDFGSATSNDKGSISASAPKYIDNNEQGPERASKGRERTGIKPGAQSTDMNEPRSQMTNNTRSKKTIDPSKDDSRVKSVSFKPKSSDSSTDQNVKQTKPAQKRDVPGSQLRSRPGDAVQEKDGKKQVAKSSQDKQPNKPLRSTTDQPPSLPQQYNKNKAPESTQNQPRGKRETNNANLQPSKQRKERYPDSRTDAKVENKERHHGPTKTQSEEPKLAKPSKRKPEPTEQRRKPKARGPVIVNDMDDLFKPTPSKHEKSKERGGQDQKAQSKRNAPRSSKRRPKPVSHPQDDGRPDIPDMELRLSDNVDDDSDSDSDEDIFQKAMRKYGINVDDSD